MVQIDFMDGNFVEYVVVVWKLDLDIVFIIGIVCWDGCEMEYFWCEWVFVVLLIDYLLVVKV